MDIYCTVCFTLDVPRKASRPKSSQIRGVFAGEKNADPRHFSTYHIYLLQTNRRSITDVSPYNPDFLQSLKVELLLDVLEVFFSFFLTLLHSFSLDKKINRSWNKDRINMIYR